MTTALVARGECSIVIARLGVAAGIEPDFGPRGRRYVSSWPSPGRC